MKNDIPENQIIIGPRHLEVFHFINTFIHKMNYSPSVEEITLGLDIKWRTLYRLMNDLEKAGYISWKKRYRNGIMVLKKDTGR